MGKVIEMRRRNTTFLGGIIVVLVLVLVGGVLLLGRSGDKRELRSLSEKMEKVLARKADIEEYFEEKVEDLKEYKSEETEKFLVAVRDVKETVGDDDFCASSAFRKDKEHGVEMREACDRVKYTVDNLGDLAETAEKLDGLAHAVAETGRIPEETITEFAESGNEFLREFGQDFEEYREKISEFKEKYQDTDEIDKNKLQEEYGVVQNLGIDLLKKYKEDVKEQGYAQIFDKDGALHGFADAEKIRDWAQERL